MRAMRAMRAKRTQTIPINVHGCDLVDPAELVPHPRNPRQGDVGKLTQLIRANGFCDPLTVNRHNRRVGGNHCLQAAISLAMPLVPVVWVDIADEQREIALLLSLNAASDAGSYDSQALADLLHDLDAQGVDLDATGYDRDALDYLQHCLDTPLTFAPAPAHTEPTSEAPTPRGIVCPNCHERFWPSDDDGGIER